MQKSLPADKSEKEIFKNALTLNKNKIKKSRGTVAHFIFRFPHRTDTLSDRQKRRAAPNKGLPQWRVTSKLKGHCFLLSLLHGDSFVVVNPPLRASPEPLWASLLDDTTTESGRQESPRPFILTHPDSHLRLTTNFYFLKNGDQQSF